MENWFTLNQIDATTYIISEYRTIFRTCDE